MGLAESLERLMVWAEGQIIDGYDPSTWRRDELGSVMRYEDYGDRNSEFGWEIDHRVPNALGGLDYLSNKRPLHWRNNASLGGGLASFFRG